MMRALLCAAALALLAPGAWAQPYPWKPVRIVVPFAPGGGTDGIARLFAIKLVEQWGQQVLIDNRAGAGGSIGSNVVAKSPPDGYTLLFTPSGLAILPALFRKLPFEAADFLPVTQVVHSHLVLVTNPKLPASSVQELVALARSRPGKMNYGSSGIGAPSHLMGELLRTSAGLDIIHIPYKGDAQSIPALMAEEVQMVFVPIFIALPHMKSGRVRGLAVVGLARSRSAPDLPTMVEAGQSDFELSSWQGLFAPAGTPRDIVGKIHSGIVSALASRDAAVALPALGLEPGGNSPEEFASLYRSEVEKYGRIVRSAGIAPLD